MKVVFLGCFTPAEKVEELRTKCRFYDMPGGVLQNALISGFDANAELQIITSPNLKSVPNGRLNGFEFSHNGKSVDYCIGYRDKIGVREYDVTQGILKRLNQIGEIDVIFIYSMIFPLLFSANKYKKRHPGVKIIQMITDLPQFMRVNASLTYSLAKKVDTVLNYKLMKCVDEFALLSLHMGEFIPVKGKKWVQVEGIYEDPGEKINCTKFKERTILYTGNLGKRYGILNLIAAFMHIDNPNYRLWIRGDGACKEYVKQIEGKDHRIKYIERLSRSELLKLQREATLLINPVWRKEQFTRYYFPSKTMEYMASGTPTLMSELDCLPEDYKEHLYFFDDESVEGMAQKIEEICSKPQEELDAFGKAASEFILKYKTPEAQVRKMLGALL